MSSSIRRCVKRFWPGIARASAADRWSRMDGYRRGWGMCLQRWSEIRRGVGETLIYEPCQSTRVGHADGLRGITA